MGGASVYTILQQKSQKNRKKEERKKKLKFTQIKKINLGWVSGGASSSIIFSSIGENFGA